MGDFSSLSFAFFKEKGVKYVYHKPSNTIIFPCFHCFLSDAGLDCSTGQWTCRNCGNVGNLKTLIDAYKGPMLKDLSHVKVFNPGDYRKRINAKFRTLANDNDLISRDLKRLKEMVDFLLDHYKKDASERV